MSLISEQDWSCISGPTAAVPACERWLGVVKEKVHAQVQVWMFVGLEQLQVSVSCFVSSSCFLNGMYLSGRNLLVVPLSARSRVCSGSATELLSGQMS